MATHSEHYPTMIENPKTGQRVGVTSPLAHHRQLLAWGQEGLDPVPAEPLVAQVMPVAEPGYPTMIENEGTGERVQVNSKSEHDTKLAFWKAKTPKSTTRPPAAAPTPAPAVPKPAAAGSAKATTGRGAMGKAGAAGKLPPTKEELMAKNYPESIAEKMADEETRKYNAGEAPYDAPPKK